MDNEKQKKDLDSAVKNTLTKFVEDNQKLISILGVFTALTVFTANLSFRPVGYVLSFIFLALTLIIWLELLEKFPKGEANWKLKIFEILLGYSFLGIVFYWLIAYPDIWDTFMFFPLTIILGTIITSLLIFPIKKYNLFNRFFNTESGKLKVVRHILFFVIAVLTLYISIGIAFVISPTINKILDGVRKDMLEWKQESSPQSVAQGDRFFRIRHFTNFRVGRSVSGSLSMKNFSNYKICLIKLALLFWAAA